MNIKARLNSKIIIEILFILLFINYFTVTIVLRNRFPFSYFRDCALLLLMCIAIRKRKVKFEKKTIKFLTVFGISLVIGAIRSYSLYTIIQESRRYLFPLILFILLRSVLGRRETDKIVKYILYMVSFIGVWGVFQAFVLKDQFLIKLGYPTRYAIEYGRVALNYSFYFGNLGIQRVASTFSSSNICGAVLGITLIFFIINYEHVKSIKYYNICIISIAVAYILTFSRANFLAMLIVLILIMWPYIPKKKTLFLVGGGLGVLIFVCIMIYNKDILLKIAGWVVDSMHLRDSSSAGRGSIWITALREVIQNPFGIGIGYTGENAYQAGASIVFACENSYLSMALDIGVVGMISYFMFWIYYAKILKKYAGQFKGKDSLLEKKFCLSIYCILIYLMIISFFSNHFKDMELISFVALFVAMGMNFIENKKIKYIEFGGLYE